MKEQWIKWEPIKDLEKKYAIDSIVWDEKGFTIILSDVEKKGKRVKVFFDTWVDTYRRIDKPFCDDLILELNQKYEEIFCYEWTFFKASSSEYMQWLSKESSTISEIYELMHFSLITANAILDIAVNYEPIVDFLDSRYERKCYERKVGAMETGRGTCREVFDRFHCG